MKVLTTLIDLALIALLFPLMAAGYLLYFFLYPFYRGGRLLKYVFAAGAALFLVILLAFGALLYEAGQKRSRRTFSESILTVEKGSTLDEITAMLTRLGIIDAPLQFRVMATLKGFSKKMKAGSYIFNTQMPMEEILDRIAQGRTYSGLVTVPEGSLSWQIASQLQTRLQVDSAAFMGLVNDSLFAASLGVPCRTLEGFLFPETYYFGWREAPRSVITAMVRRFKSVYAALNPARAPASRRYGMREIVIMASIVEAEAVADQERPMIAGVFYNRLRKGMPLGADPTVRYALRKYGGRQLTKSDLKLDSPYNTRLYRGLPPGPVCNPGAAALNAALNPLDTDKLYFVAKYDGSGEHYFSSSNAEHTLMKKQSRENSRNREQGARDD